MIVGWNDDRCVICLEASPLSEEHLIPASLGGLVSAVFVCKACNDKFGYGFEASARSSPAIRLAAASLRHELPALAESIEKGQAYVVRVSNPKVEFRTTGGPRARGKAADGSLLVPSEDAPAVITTMMRRDGATSRQISRALARFASTDVGQHVSLGTKIEAVNWDHVTARMDFDGALDLSSLVPLKAAFEFATLLIGTSAYAAAPLAHIRSILLEQDEKAAAALVTFGHAGDYRPLHGLLFEGNSPEARVQVRLFGKLSYRVTLPSIAINAPRFSATMDLASRAVDFVDHSDSQSDASSD
jgi:hypothetical protein